MSNWCQNKLTVTGNKLILSFFDEFMKDGFAFSKLDPMPIHLLNNRVTIDTGRMPGWYEWALEHWGTKWDLNPPVMFKDGVCLFETAWSPPIAAIKTLSDTFITLKFELDWYEEAGTAGHAAFTEGVVKEKQWTTVHTA